MTEINNSENFAKCNREKHHRAGPRSEAKALGLATYLLGTPCKRGHMTARRTDTSACIECMTERHRRARTPETAARVAFFELDRAARAAAQAAGQKTYQPVEPCSKGHVAPRSILQGHCTECNRLRNAKRRADDPEWCAAARKRYYEANADKIKARVRVWREDNPETARAMVKAWKKANPEAKAAQARTRRARAIGEWGRHTAADIKQLYRAQDGWCTVCKTDLDRAGYHVDHIVALAAGGSNAASNLQLLCPPCNMRKGAKPFDEFLLDYLTSGF